MQITVKINEKRLDQLLSGHGGSMSTSWLREWIVDRAPNGDVSKITARWLAENDTEASGEFKLGKIHNGISRFVQDHPKHFADFMGENDDDVTFDVAAQCIVFGKIVYG